MCNHATTGLELITLISLQVKWLLTGSYSILTCRFIIMWILQQRSLLDWISSTQWLYGFSDLCWSATTVAACFSVALEAHIVAIIKHILQNQLKTSQLWRRRVCETEIPPRRCVDWFSWWIIHEGTHRQVWYSILWFTVSALMTLGRGNTLLHHTLTSGFTLQSWTDDHDLRTLRGTSLYIYVTFYVWLLQIL